MLPSSSATNAAATPAPDPQQPESPLEGGVVHLVADHAVHGEAVGAGTKCLGRDETTQGDCILVVETFVGVQCEDPRWRQVRGGGQQTVAVPAVVPAERGPS